MQPSFEKPKQHEIGVGPTERLSLRVSVAALCRVLFLDPEAGRTMLALERTATLREKDGLPEVTVRAKPFGGAVRLSNPQALKEMIGDFHYDSERSRQENDFRLQINPASWEKVKSICREQLNEAAPGILDSSPDRELAEEFADALNVTITPDQYTLTARGMVAEELPRGTDSVRAAGRPTVRIYYVYEAWIVAPEIITLLLNNSSRYSDTDLRNMAWQDAQNGGRGRANGVVALGLDELRDVYRSVPTDRRDEPLRVGSHQLDGNVLAILEEVMTPKYQLDVRHSR